MPAAVLITGEGGVPQRVREELDALGVASALVGDPATADGWWAADLASTSAVGLLGADDLSNLQAALLVAELHPTCRIVVRMSSTDMRHGIERMLGSRGAVLSEIELAAPAFLQAALSGNEGQRVTAAGRVLEVAEVDVDDPRLVVALCNPDTPTEVLPPRARLARTVLALIDPQGVVYTARGALPASVAAHTAVRRRPPRSGPTRRARLTAALRLVPRRAWILLVVIATVATISTAVFALSKHLEAIDAAYFTATTMATVGYGDVNLLTAPDWLKIYDIGLMIVSAVLLASVLAMLTDLLVTSRIERALGRFPIPRADHVIVCGLGKAGTAIVRGLSDLGVACVAVEQHDGAAGISVARELQVPVVIGDARQAATLERLHVRSARSLMAVTNDDLANLQAALAARERSPGVRVVLRIFDRGLGERLDRTVDLDLTRSISGLSAPAFAAALLDLPLAQPLALSNVPLRVADLHVATDSPLAGRAVRDLNGGRDLRVLALDGRWRPRDDVVVQAGMPISIVGTREACDALQRPR